MLRRIRTGVGSVLIVAMAMSAAYIRLLPNQCEMSYSYPSYAAVGGGHPRYRLLRFTNAAPRWGGLPSSPVQEIPVLFVPGNQGHFGQVRSLAGASDAWCRQLGTRCRAPLAWYTLDFAEEPSGLDESVFLEQVEWLRSALLGIPGDGPVVIVAHSVGALVAQAALQPDMSRVALMVSIAPALPTLAIVPGKVFAEAEHATTRMNGTRFPVVNVLTGPRDVLVSDREGLLGGDGVVARRPSEECVGNEWTVRTRAVPGVGFSIDHFASLWCAQLVQRLVKGLHSATSGKCWGDAFVSDLTGWPPSPVQRSEQESTVLWQVASVMGSLPPSIVGFLPGVALARLWSAEGKRGTELLLWGTGVALGWRVVIGDATVLRAEVLDNASSAVLMMIGWLVLDGLEGWIVAATRGLMKPSVASRSFVLLGMWAPTVWACVMRQVIPWSHLATMLLTIGCLFLTSDSPWRMWLVPILLGRNMWALPWLVIAGGIAGIVGGSQQQKQRESSGQTA
jgi:hypothetical protein